LGGEYEVARVVGHRALR